MSALAPTLLVPNPAKARALANVSAARSDVATAHAQLSKAIDAGTIRAPSPHRPLR